MKRPTSIPQPQAPSPEDDAAEQRAAKARRQAARERIEQETGRTVGGSMGTADDQTDTAPIELSTLAERATWRDRVSRASGGVKAAGEAVRSRSISRRGGDQSSADGTTETGETPGSWKHLWKATRARRRVMRQEVRRFTVRARRRRLAWIIGMSAVVAVVAVSFGISYSPIFAVQTITVEGAELLDAPAVEEALSGQVGTPLALVNEGEVTQALEPFTQIERYALEARPPHELVVRVTERTPIGVVATDGGFVAVDAAGVQLATTPDNPGLPVIEVADGAGSPAFEAVGMVLRTIPDDIRSQVVQATATGPEDVTLTLAESGAQVIWGSYDDSTTKADTLRSALIAIPADEVTVYDVSASGTLVVR